MNDLPKRLKASVGMDAINGDSFERSICGKQMMEAAKYIESLEQQLTALQAEKERLEQSIIDGVIALITFEQKSICNLYTKHAYGINKVCNRLKLFVGDMTKHPTQEPSDE